MLKGGPKPVAPFTMAPPGPKGTRTVRQAVVPGATHPAWYALLPSAFCMRQGAGAGAAASGPLMQGADGFHTSGVWLGRQAQL